MFLSTRKGKSELKKELTLSDVPTADAAQKAEENAGSGKGRRRLSGRQIFYIVFAVVAVLILAAAVFMPVLHIDSSTMEPTLAKGDVVLSMRFSDYKNGDILAVECGNKILVKRCIAVGGQTVDIDRQGNVYVDGDPIDEPYIINRALGNCTAKLPYKVAEGSYFCMGDNRYLSLDSRSTTVGAIEQEKVVGKVLFCVWPLTSIGFVE